MSLYTLCAQNRNSNSLPRRSTCGRRLSGGYTPGRIVRCPQLCSLRPRRRRSESTWSVAVHLTAADAPTCRFSMKHRLSPPNRLIKLADAGSLWLCAGGHNAPRQSRMAGAISMLKILSSFASNKNFLSPSTSRLGRFLSMSLTRARPDFQATANGLRILAQGGDPRRMPMTAAMRFQPGHGGRFRSHALGDFRLCQPSAPPGTLRPRA